MSIAYFISKILKKIQIPAIKNSTIDKRSKIASASNILDVKIGKYSYIGNYCTIIDAKIGNFCSIADNVIIGGAAHPLDWISTSPVFYQGKNILNKNFSEHNFKAYNKTIIKNDVWIANNCLIKAGIIVENGAIIGMGSVVTKNVGAYEIWAGNPAKLIRKRFDSEVIKIISNSNWWNWDDTEITKNSHLMNKQKDFIDFLINKKDCISL